MEENKVVGSISSSGAAGNVVETTAGLAELKERTTTGTTSTISEEAKPIPPPSPLLQQEKKSVVGRAFHPPKLERKHSSGDLHSRLKTRKILGVGETDNGDIHRSKISQVLGHNEHLYLKLPKGSRSWQLFLTILLASQGVFIILFPSTARELGLTGIAKTSTNSVASQYYAGTMLALAFLLWKFINMNDKAVTRAIQTAALMHFAFLFLVDVLYALKNDGLRILLEVSVLAISTVRITVVLVCFFYLGRIGAATSGLRRSPSYKDLVESSTRKD